MPAGVLFRRHHSQKTPPQIPQHTLHQLLQRFELRLMDRRSELQPRLGCDLNFQDSSRFARHQQTPVSDEPALPVRLFVIPISQAAAMQTSFDVPQCLLLPLPQCLKLKKETLTQEKLAVSAFLKHLIFDHLSFKVLFVRD